MRGEGADKHASGVVGILVEAGGPYFLLRQHLISTKTSCRETDREQLTAGIKHSLSQSTIRGDLVGDQRIHPSVRLLKSREDCSGLKW